MIYSLEDYILISKGNNSNVTISDNYHGLVPSSILGQILEMLTPYASVIISLISSLVFFKSSIAMCNVVTKEIISYNAERGNSILYTV